jgi:hypothetical protein
MTSNAHRHARCAVAALLLGTMATAVAEPRLEHDWFRIEVILFERSTPDATAGNEQLEVDRPRYLPREMVAFDLDDAARRQLFRLTAEQIDALRLPAPRPPFSSVLTDVFSGLDDVLVELGLAEPEPEHDDTAYGDPLGDPFDADATRAPVTHTEQPPTPQPGAPDVPVLTATERAMHARAEAVRDFEDGLHRTAFRLLPESGHQLVREASRLRTNRGFDVVFHGAWQQPVPERGAPLPVLIQTGPRLGDQWRYEGTLAVTLGRFLHVHANLWRQSEPVPNGLPRGAFEAAPRLPRAASGRYEQLDEHRRMRSTEVHYLDHPRFGILVRIDPVDMPEPLTQLETFLEGDAGRRDDAPPQ